MKAQFLKSVLAPVLSLTMLASLTACGVGVEDSDQFTKPQEQEAQKRRDEYARAKGTYDGTLTLLSDEGIAPQGAQFFLSVLEKDEGYNPDGTRKIIPTLVGRFQLNDVVATSDYVSLGGQYNRVSGTLIMTPPTAVAAADSLEISGTAANDSASFIVSKNGQAWGKFEGRRTSLETVSQAGSDDLKRRTRLFAVYRQIEGSYSGTIRSRSQSIPVSLIITAQEATADPNQPGVRIPTLVATYRRLDTSAGIGNYVLAVNYDQLTQRMTMTATSGGSPSVPGSGVLSATGTWVNGMLDVSFRNSFGDMGDLKVQRQPLSGQ